MRISSWVVGLAAFGMLIISTGLCAVVTYSGTRGAIVDLWSGGIRVESPGEVAQAVLNPGSQPAAIATPIPPAQGGVVMIPSVTPQATATSLADAPTDPADVSATAEPDTINAQENPLPTPTPDTVVIEPTPLDAPAADEYQWTDPFAINVLLMGIDQRAEGFDTERAHRTDTMIVAHINPVTKRAALISFPRDLWVDIPDYEPARINTANYIGDINAYPGGGGPALAMETLKANFGIDIDYYGMINFTVFEEVVKLIAPNGVEVCVNEYILDEDYPDAGFGTIRVEFQPGCQQMDGTKLLQYARTRATSGGDIDRARRQQQVLFALRDHVLSVGGISEIARQVVPLWNELSGSYRTNIDSLDELFRLASLIGEVPRENIETVVVGPPDYADLGTNANGDKVLIPFRSRINSMLQDAFYGADTTADSGSLQARAAQENVPVRVFNSTTISGLAANVQVWLSQKGVRVTEVGNTTTSVPATVIRNYGGGRNTALWLADVMGIPSSQVQSGSDGLVGSGVAIILGPDAQDIIQGD